MAAMMKRRHGFSLLELLAVVAILGVLIGAGFAAMRIDSVGNHAAGVAARQLASDIEQARRQAIATGSDHFLQFTLNGSAITGYTLRRDTGGGSTAVDTYRAIPEHVVATISPSGSVTPDFNFEGHAAGSFTLNVAGPQRSWQVIVTAATGRPRVVGPN
jgi:prepilin-type N-terminal cleavage/methylation domain-containing protein